MRLLICGGRDWDNQGRMDEVADAIHAQQPVALLINGGQVSYDKADWGRRFGADYQAEQWAKKRGIRIRYYLPDWNCLGRAAGPVRNQRMVADGKPDMVVAFPGGLGTADCVTRAKAAGIQVVEVADLPISVDT